MNRQKEIIIIAFVLCLISVFDAYVIADNGISFPKESLILKDLENLREKGVISSGELEKIKEYLQKDKEEKREIFKKAKNMSEEERKEFIKNYRKNKISFIDKMVEDKVIKKDQAKKIKEIMQKYKRGNKGKKGG